MKYLATIFLSVCFVQLSTATPAQSSKLEAHPYINDPNLPDIFHRHNCPAPPVCEQAEMLGVELQRFYCQLGTGTHYYLTDESLSQQALNTPAWKCGLQGNPGRMRVLARPLPGTVPLYHMTGGGGHYYTTSLALHTAARAGGYSSSSVIGYVFQNPVCGAVALHMLSRRTIFNGNRYSPTRIYGTQTPAIDFILTTTQEEIQAATAAQFTYNGAIGYVLPLSG